MKRHKFTASHGPEKRLTIVCEYCGFIVFDSLAFDNENDSRTKEAAKGCVLGTTDQAPAIFVPGTGTEPQIVTKAQQPRKTRDGYTVYDNDEVYEPCLNGCWKPQKLRAFNFKRTYEGFFKVRETCQEYCDKLNRQKQNHNESEF